ncbi:GlxA family transcriptional regulator [Lentzea sp. NPDC060358]|uniref:GlxA family transcriptional regulator n=1 Tax=Lentzea sp. NPDC060358 TaxID=3347103 RepID=UPI003650605A
MNDNIRNNHAMPHKVAVFALDGVMPFDLGIASRVLLEALDADGARLYSVSTCSLGGLPVRTDGDFSVTVDHDERLLAGADTVVIATQKPTGDLLESGVLDDAVARALDLIRPGTRVVSLCTSAFVLAAAGWLDGLAATTHWALTDRFRRLFPAVHVRPDVLFVDEGRILTSAGGAAGIDLCLHLVRRDHGADVANAAARRCVVAPWRDGGQAQFIEHPLPRDDHSSTAPTRAWALTRLGSSLTLADMAEHAHMSVRTFGRRFHAEVGTSPAQWIIQRRVDRARALLETTALHVDEVARQVGFGSSTLLRKHLHSSVGVTPTAYRRTFQPPGA